MLPGWPLQTTTATPTPPVTPNETRSVLAELLPTWAQVPGWEVVVAVVIVALGGYLSKFAVRLLGRPVARRFRRQSVAQTVLRLVRVSVFAVGVVIAAALVGFEFGNIVLSVTVFSAVLGIILAPIAGSVINGLFVLADQPFEIGDMIELEDGRRGFVDDITIRYTKVFTLDNTFLVVPNSNIRDRDVVNYSAEDERTRLELELLVTYEGDLQRARNIMQRAAVDTNGVIEGGPDIRIGSARYPARPTVYIETYGDHGVLLNLRYWVERPYRIPAIRSAVQSRIWSLLEEADDVEIAYPHQHHVFDETSGQASVAVERAAPAADRDADAEGVEASDGAESTDATE